MYIILAISMMLGSILPVSCLAIIRRSRTSNRIAAAAADDDTELLDRYHRVCAQLDLYRHYQEMQSWPSAETVIVDTLSGKLDKEIALKKHRLTKLQQECNTLDEVIAKKNKLVADCNSEIQRLRELIAMGNPMAQYEQQFARYLSKNIGYLQYHYVPSCPCTGCQTTRANGRRIHP